MLCFHLLNALHSIYTQELCLASNANDITRFILCYVGFPYKNNITIVGAVSGGTVSAEAILTCNVTSFPSANYSWTDLKYGNSSSGPHLTVWHDGSYKCTTSNYFNEQWHWASKIISNLTVESKSVRTCSFIECLA